MDIETLWLQISRGDMCLS